MKRGIFLFVWIIVFLVSLASAQVFIKNVSVNQDYGIGSIITGKINLSLQKEPGSSILEISIGDLKKSVSLIDFLRNAGGNFSCDSLNCQNIYSETNPLNEKTFSVEPGTRVFKGLKFNGNIENIGELKFNLTSNAPEICAVPLFISFGNYSEINFVPTQASNSFCSSSRNYSCFDQNSQNTENYYIGTDRYCQNFKLSMSPGLKIGAWVKKNGATSVNTMALLDSEGNQLDSCNLQDADTNGGEIFCNVNAKILKQNNYYVCISSDRDSEYQVKGLVSSSKCGYRGDSLDSPIASYQIFVEQKKYAAIGTVEINSSDVSLSEGESDIGLRVLNYLKNLYNVNDNGAVNCSDGCVFPISFTSSIKQDVKLSGLNGKYVKESGAVSLNSFYDVSEKVASLSSDQQILDLSFANVSVPGVEGNYTFSVKLNGNEISNGKIQVRTTATIDYIIPTKTGFGIEQIFYAGINNHSKEIKKYVWDFGDGETAESDKNIIKHIYKANGNYTLTIYITDNDFFVTKKSFLVEVGSPKEIINILIQERVNSLSRIKNNIKTLPENLQTIFNDVLNLSSDDDSLKNLQTKYIKASSDQDYEDILQDLGKINIPLSINVTEKANRVTFFPEESVIDLQAIADKAGGKVENTSASQVLSWMNQNVKVKVDYKEYSSIYSSERIDPLVRTFSIDITPKKDFSDDYYLFLSNLDNVKFQDAYGERLSSNKDYYSIPLDKNEKKISFSTSSNVDFISLPMWISPSLNRLPLLQKKNEEAPCNFNKMCDANENWKTCSDCRPTSLYFISIIIFIIIGVGGYIFLYNWYKKNYEKSLFRNPNDLYNIISYIHASKQKNILEKDLRKNLSAAGWSSEQINYAIKKYAGKRTGLWIPGQ